MEINEITAQMDECKKLKARLDFESKENDKEMEKLELQLVQVLSQLGVDYCEHGIYSFGFKTAKRVAFDQKLFGQENPELLEKYKTTKESQRFEFKINA